MKFQPFVESDCDREEPEKLKAKLEKDGYLFLRRLIDPRDLAGLRRQFLEICAAHGWLLENSSLDVPRGKQNAFSGYFEFTDVYREIQMLEDFHALPHHPRLLGTLQRIFGGDVLPHARNIARITTPNSFQLTTPSHQDYVFIQGSTETYTMWMPLTDCPFELGGLAMAAGSHQLGIFPTKKAEGTGGLCTDVDDNSLEWHASPFAAGDVIVFHSLTIHKAFPNTTTDRLRLSCDFRYQPLTDPTLGWNSLRPHMQLHGWEKIYSGWKRDTYKYYWQKYALHMIPDVHPEKVEPTVHRK